MYCYDGKSTFSDKGFGFHDECGAMAFQNLKLDG
jgi:hypothetical protein